MKTLKITLANGFHRTTATLRARISEDGRTAHVSKEAMRRARKKLCRSDTCLCASSPASYWREAEEWPEGWVLIEDWDLRDDFTLRKI